MTKTFLAWAQAGRKFLGGAFAAAAVAVFAAAPAALAQDLNPAQKAARIVVATQVCNRLIQMFAEDARVSALVAQHQNNPSYAAEYKTAVAAHENYQMQDEAQFRAVCQKVDQQMNAAE